MKIGNKEFRTQGHTYVMGILNVTPDSFSDGGKWNDKDRALKHVEDMVAEGADIIDIGGESTRPGYTLLPEEEEIRRVVPVIEAVKAAFDVPVSLDTYKAQVAEASGIGKEKIILDPGVGFAKSYEQNLEVVRGLGELGKLGLPLLLGCSRKSVIGLSLDLPADQRIEGTLVTTVFGVMAGCMFVRVHDVRENIRAIRMAEAILGNLQG